MANRKLFSTSSQRRVPVADTVNKAGGRAYSTSDAHALCQYVVTGTFNQTFYASEGEQLETVKKLVQSVEPELIAKAAVYGHETARMKDVPAYLLAVLAAKGEITLLRQAFSRVITNVKMLANFVQIIRSGETGRRSFGTAVRSLIRNWLNSQHPAALFAGNIGQANPSLADIIKMVHVRPQDAAHQAIFAYILDKDHEFGALPLKTQNFELFKKGEVTEVPNVPFRALTNITLTADQWRQIGRDMPWNTLRMNLNMLSRKGAFDDKGYVKEIAGKLGNAELVHRSRVFPYQIMTAYQNVDGLPSQITNALQDALEAATENVPEFGKDVAVCVDTSASMGSPITGYRAGASSKTSCVDVAGLIAACILRKNEDAVVVPFDTSVHTISLNPRDSVMTNAKKLARHGGGTACSVALSHLNQQKHKGDLVIYVSDNESWADYHAPSSIRRYYGGTGLAHEWTEYKRRNKNAKLVLIDLVANRGVQVKDDKDVLNIGGFSDSVFEVVSNFVKNGSGHFVDVVRAVDLNRPQIKGLSDQSGVRGFSDAAEIEADTPITV